MFMFAALRETRENLMEKLKQCMSQQACIDFMRNYNITHLSLEKDFTQVVFCFLNNIKIEIYGSL